MSGIVTKTKRRRGPGIEVYGFEGERDGDGGPRKERLWRGSTTREPKLCSSF